MTDDRGKTFPIPGPMGKGHPDYEVGYRHGVMGRDALDRRNATYMSGWADGRKEPFAVRKEDSDDR